MYSKEYSWMSPIFLEEGSFPGREKQSLWVHQLREEVPGLSHNEFPSARSLASSQPLSVPTSQELCQEPKHKTKKQNKQKQNTTTKSHHPLRRLRDRMRVWCLCCVCCAGHTGGPAPAAMPARALSTLPPLGTEAEAPGRVISRIGTHLSAGTGS